MSLKNYKAPTLAEYSANITSAMLTIFTLTVFGLSELSDDIKVFLLQTLAYLCLFCAFNWVASRFFKWLYD